MEPTESFGELLKRVIKASEMSQSTFYTKLGITKPYFYDILSGKVNPPPPALQFKAVEILKLDRTTAQQFYDTAARERHELPVDIVQWITDNPSEISDMRIRISKKL